MERSASQRFIVNLFCAFFFLCGRDRSNTLTNVQLDWKSHQVCVCGQWIPHNEKTNVTWFYVFPNLLTQITPPLQCPGILEVRCINSNWVMSKVVPLRRQVNSLAAFHPGNVLYSCFRSLHPPFLKSAIVHESTSEPYTAINTSVDNR